MAFGNPAAGEPGTVQERNQYPLHSQRRENLPDRNEDEEPGTVLSCVIGDAGIKELERTWKSGNAGREYDYITFRYFRFLKLFLGTYFSVLIFQACPLSVCRYTPYPQFRISGRR